MAVRSLWKGFLKLSLVSVAVKAYNAATGGTGIALNQLHAKCKSRIRYKKTCPIHGEVQASDIVHGYEYSKNQYVEIDTAELEKLRTEDDKAIRIDVFIDPASLDPVYLTGKNYYLLPDGPVASHAFGVIFQAMKNDNRYAVAKIVMHDKEQIVVLRPLDGLLVMSPLNYSSQVASPSTFEEEIPQEVINPSELQLAKTLIKSAFTPKFDMARYKDEYTERMSQLIEAKVAGQEIVSPPAAERVPVINLMDALKKSLAQKGVQEPTTTKKPPRKMAQSKGTASAAKKKKSS